MNYLKHYILLIRKRKDIILDSNFEKHHIIPQCIMEMRGHKHIMNKPWNIIRLTPREHYIAHLLLYKMANKLYPNTDISHKLGYAVVAMGIVSGQRIKQTSRLYESIRQSINAHKSINLKNKIISAETREKMSKSAKARGRNNTANLSFAGMKHTPETIERIRQGNLGRKITDKQLAYMRSPKSKEHIEKIASKLRGRTRGHSDKKLLIDGVEYESYVQAEKILKLSYHMLRKRGKWIPIT